MRVFRKQLRYCTPVALRFKKTTLQRCRSFVCAIITPTRSPAIMPKTESETEEAIQTALSTFENDEEIKAYSEEEAWGRRVIAVTNALSSINTALDSYSSEPVDHLRLGEEAKQAIKSSVGADIWAEGKKRAQAIRNWQKLRWSNE